MWDRSSPPVAWRFVLPLLGLYAALVMARYPILIRSPRLWAEEGSKYFQSAHDLGLLAVFVSEQGYFSLVPRVATWLATLVPLAFAPVVTVVISLLLQMVPALVVLRSRSAVLPLAGRILIVAALIFTPQAVGELWLNTINSQVFLAVAAFVIFLEPTLRPRHWAWLALAAFTAPTAIFLAPLFALRALRQPTRGAWVSVAVFGVAGLVDALCVVGHRPGSGGRGIGDTLAAWLQTIVAEGFIGGVPASAQLVVGAVVLVVLAVIFGATADTGAWVLALAALVVSLLNAEFALMGKVADRYAYAPVLMAVIALVVAAGSSRDWARIPVGAALATALLGGVFGYFAPSPSVDKRWPSWRSQVESGATVIQLWPKSNNFIFYLVPRS
jgi:hypothetical protein